MHLWCNWNFNRYFCFWSSALITLIFIPSKISATLNICYTTTNSHACAQDSCKSCRYITSLLPVDCSAMCWIEKCLWNTLAIGSVGKQYSWHLLNTCLLSLPTCTTTRENAWPWTGIVSQARPTSTKRELRVWWTVYTSSVPPHSTVQSNHIAVSCHMTHYITVWVE